MVEAPLNVFLITVAWIPLENNSSNGPLIIGYLIPMQFALQLIHCIFVYMELIFGFFALRVLARYQISRFHYKQFDDNYNKQSYEKLNNNENYDNDYNNLNLNWLETLHNNHKSFNKILYNFIIFY